MRRFLVETIVFSILMTIGGAVPEIFIVKLTLTQCATSRLLNLPVCALQAWPYARYREFLFRTFRADDGTATRKFLVDAFANSTFQTATYAAILLATGAPLHKCVALLAIGAASSAISGRILGWTLERMKKLLHADEPS